MHRHVVIKFELHCTLNNYTWHALHRGYLRASLGAVHNSVTLEKGPLVTHLIETLLLEVITRVHHPPVRLHDDSWSEILVTVPPVARTRCTAACAQDALIHAVLQVHTHLSGTCMLTTHNYSNDKMWQVTVPLTNNKRSWGLCKNDCLPRSSSFTFFFFSHGSIERYCA